MSAGRVAEFAAEYTYASVISQLHPEALFA